ncbi:MAG TPA: FG-GAP-like repeat-containing protein [Pyrinomonadaceae bacterium]|nr:FG-GAP-like repeat-containing protein [Pyrinomonadaceae bacterium]
MRNIPNVPSRGVATRGVNQPRRPGARLFTFLFLCLCVGAALRLDSTAAAATGCTTPTFGPPTSYGAGILRSLAVGEFDDDGNTDLYLLTDLGASYFILAFLGDGTGAFPNGFGLGESVGNIDQALAFAVADFDGKGEDDFVVANGRPGRGHATVYLNSDGDPFFDGVTPLSWMSPGVGNVSSSVAVADFNADGKQDVVVTSRDSNAVLVALGVGNGTFSNFKTYSSGGQLPEHVVVRDFNADGKPDLAVANSIGVGNNVAVLLGDGTGNFGAATAYAAGASPTFIATGDFNADNKIDLAVVANSGAQNVSILFGNGAGGFSAPSFVTSGGQPAVELAATDFNGDGKTDLAVVNEHEANVAILLGDGAGNFSLSSSPVTGSTSPGAIVTPDLNGDGMPDLVVGHEDARILSVLLNGCGATTSSFSFNQSFASASEAAGGLTFTVIRNGSTAGTATVNYSTAYLDVALVPADTGSDYKATSGTLTFADGETSKTFTVELVNDTLDESTELFLVRLSNPTGAAVLGGLNELAARITDDDPALALSVDNPTVNEGARHATVTITRTSDPSGVASVAYRTADADNFTVACSDTTRNNGNAFARCDFATVVGTVNFAAGETQKTITIPIIDDGHDEGAETFGVLLLNAGRPDFTRPLAGSNVTIQDNDAAGAPNPVTTSHPFFVRQQYLDFLSREPDQDGFEAWLRVLNGCANPNTGPGVPSNCDRIYVSGEGFFRSLEFQLKGAYVFRFYKLAFDRLPEYTEIVSDMSFVAGQTAEEVYARKAQLAQLFTGRDEFRNAYDFVPDSQFVATLLGRYQLTQITTPDPAQPDGATKVTLTQAALVAAFEARTLTRAQVFRAIADSDEVQAAEFNNTFVAMQYYGYLRRKPDPDGYAAWLAVLQRGDVRTMVNGFLNSTEYKLRFGNL